MFCLRIFDAHISKTEYIYVRKKLFLQIKIFWLLDKMKKMFGSSADPTKNMHIFESFYQKKVNSHLNDLMAMHCVWTDCLMLQDLFEFSTAKLHAALIKKYFQIILNLILNLKQSIEIHCKNICCCSN